MSAPPPGHSPSTAAAQASPAVDRRREIVLELQPPKGWRRRAGAVRLTAAELIVEAPGVLREPLTLPGGLISVACVERGGRASGEHGRFPVLYRTSPTTVVPREEGIEGWVWTSSHGSVLPVLTEGDDVTPNLALMFVRPLEADEAERAFEPEWMRRLAARSPLGHPSVPGLLLAVADTGEAERAFKLFGVLGPMTDREVPPAMRRHMPVDRPANPAIALADTVRAATSVAPPGMG